MWTRTWCVVATLACVPTLVAAQTVLSEADALARLSDDSPRVREIRSGVDVARAEALAASRWPNPRVTFNRESAGGVTEHMFTVAQALPVTGRRALEMDAASALVAASEQRAAEAVRDVRAAVRHAYADLVDAQLRETEVTAARERVRALVEILGRREAAGESAGYDRLRAEREVVEMDADLTAARADRAAAQASLAAFFAPATDPSTLTAAVPVATAPLPLPPVEELADHASRLRPELRALRHEEESAALAIRAAGRRPIPEPEVVAGTKAASTPRRDVGSVFGVNVAVPLFDRAKPEQALARARRAQADARTASFRATLHAEVIALRTIVLERRQAAEAYRSSAATRATQLERIAQVSYDSGERGILELVDAYRISGSTRLRQVALDVSVRHAEIELERVSGWEIR